MRCYGGVSFIAVLAVCFVVRFTSDAYKFELPRVFEGTWNGAPDFAALGPISNYTFSIAQSSNGDYLMENNLNYDGLLMGYQRFYVEGIGSTAGSLWYCGSLSHYADETELAGVLRLEGLKAMTFPVVDTDLNVTFCLDSDNPDVMGEGNDNPFKLGCTFCDCANWTLSYDPATDTLNSQMSMSGADGHTHSKHMWANLRRVGPAPIVNDADMPPHGDDFACDFGDGGRDSEPVEREYPTSGTVKDTPSIDSTHHRGRRSGCPFAQNKLRVLDSRTGQPRSNSNDIDTLETTTKKKSTNQQIARNKRVGVAESRGSASFKRNGTSATSSYEHCYTINSRVGLQLAWTLDETAQVLHCALSAPISLVSLGPNPASSTLASSSSSSGRTNNSTNNNWNSRTKRDSTTGTTAAEMKNVWVAIGFRPLSRATDKQLALLGTGRHMNFGMEGADIVAGSVGLGVRTMYAELYTGSPVLDDSLAITNASVRIETTTTTTTATADKDSRLHISSGEDSKDTQEEEVEEEERVVLTFTRPLVGGYLQKHFGYDASINTGAADIIWAMGLDDEDENKGGARNAGRAGRGRATTSSSSGGGADDSSGTSTGTGTGCAYHENLRGLRFINWADPEIAMADTWKC